MLHFSCPAFFNPEYELVVLHPEHLLLAGSSIDFVDPATKPETDHLLRKSRDPKGSSFPAFRHPGRGDSSKNLNVFLVVLNAEISFQHYFEMLKTNPPANPLPSDVLALMYRTCELVELLYWKPTLQPFSQEKRMLTDSIAAIGSLQNSTYSTRGEGTSVV